MNTSDMQGKEHNMFAQKGVEEVFENNNNN